MLTESEKMRADTAPPCSPVEPFAGALRVRLHKKGCAKSPAARDDKDTRSKQLAAGRDGRTVLHGFSEFLLNNFPCKITTRTSVFDLNKKRMHLSWSFLLEYPTRIILFHVCAGARAQ